MADPLWFVFGPGAAATLAALATPIGFALRKRYRRRAAVRNRAGRCGHCGIDLLEGPEAPIYVVEARYICGRCAPILKRRLLVLLPAVGILAVVAAVSSAYGALSGGPGLDWWLSSRLIPLFLPAGGLAFGLVGGVRLMKRLNRRELGSDESGRGLPPAGSTAAIEAVKPAQVVGRGPERPPEMSFRGA